MKRRFLTAMALMMVGSSVMAAPAAADHYEWPSTNEINSANNDPHVYLVDEGPGWITLAFYDEGQGAAKFEILPDGNDDYRRNADSTCKKPHGFLHDECRQTGWNVEPNVGLYTEYGTFAVNDGWLNPQETIDVRFAGGAPSSFYFPYVTFFIPELTKADCMNGGYATLFLNQGQCIQFVNTDKDNRP